MPVHQHLLRGGSKVRPEAPRPGFEQDSTVVADVPESLIRASVRPTNAAAVRRSGRATTCSSVSPAARRRRS